MNKLMGFFELKAMCIPSIPWKEYTGEEKLDDGLLWTIRSAVYQGEDLNLPRLVGVRGNEAEKFAKGLMNRLSSNGMVIYYPYFVAKKSGTLEVSNCQIVIEAVKDDLWNMVTFSDRDVTIRYTSDTEIVDGDAEFLTSAEKKELLSYVKDIRRSFREDIITGKSVLLEWSFAQNCDVDKNGVGEEYLVFYEARTV